MEHGDRTGRTQVAQARRTAEAPVESGARRGRDGGGERGTQGSLGSAALGGGVLGLNAQRSATMQRQHSGRRALQT